MLSSGVTTFADFREGAVEGAGVLLEALQNKRIRALILGRGDYAFSEEQLEGNIGTIPQDSIQETKELLAITQGLAPSSPNDLTDEAMRQLAEITGAHGKLRAIHASEHPDSERISMNRSKLTEVQRAVKYYGADLLVHLTYASRKDLDLVADNDIAVVACPRANATLGLRLPPVPEMLDRGIVVGLGTDNVMLNSPNIFEEMAFTLKAYRIEKTSSRYLTPREVLQMATINSARALKVDDETGSIEEGKSADLAVLDLTSRNLKHATELTTSITHRARADNVSLVLVKGEIAYQRNMEGRRSILG
jgi:cytosine/adenosine deaminase-related metal-dependent hydrolase